MSVAVLNLQCHALWNVDYDVCLQVRANLIPICRDGITRVGLADLKLNFTVYICRSSLIVSANTFAQDDAHRIARARVNLNIAIAVSDVESGICRERELRRRI